MENDTENNQNFKPIKTENSEKEAENKSKSNSENQESQNFLNNLLENIIDEEEEDPKKESFIPPTSKKVLIIFFLFLILTLFIYSFKNILLSTNQKKNSKIMFPQPFSLMNDFYYYKLENGLKVLHVKIDSDSEDNVNLSLTVGAGDNSDFEGFQGLAQLMGQIFFDGSVNYEIDDYIKFVADKHEGRIEFKVKRYLSTFHFSIEDDGLEEILEPFLDSLKNPFFDEKFLRKNVSELNFKKESEYFTNRNLFNYKLLKSLGNKKSKLFHDGNYLFNHNFNYAGLKEQLQKFHDKFYKANLMSLVIVSSHEKDYIKHLIDENFGSIPSNPEIKNVHDLKNNDSKIELKIDPFDKDVFNNIHFASSLVEVPELTLNFVIDSENEFGKFQPARFFSSMITYEGKDSLTYDLYRNNLCTQIKSEFSFQDNSHGILSITFTLPEESQSKLSLIIQKFYLFIKGMKNKEVQGLFNNLKHYSKLDFFFNIDNDFFDFSDKFTSEFDSAAAYSETLLFYDPHFIYIRNNLLNNFNKDKWDHFLQSLSIEKSIMTMNSLDFKVKGQATEEKKLESKEPQTLTEILINKGLIEKETVENKDKNRILKSSLSRSLHHNPADNLRQKLINLKIILPKKNIEIEIENDEKDNNSNELEKNSKKNLILASNLEKKVDNELSNILSDFFDEKIYNLELCQNLNFDDNLAYQPVSFPENMFQEFNKILINKTKNTYENVKFPENFMIEYDITNSCKVPDFFKIKSLISEEQNFIFDLEDVKNRFVPKKSQPIDVKKVLDTSGQIIKRRNDTDLSILKKFAKLKTYKQCLYSEFKIDTKTLIMDNILDDQYIKILKKTYRQTFQNKFVIYLEVSSPLLVNSIISETNIDNKIKFSLTVDLFCFYFKEHINFNYSLLMMQGNKFSCELNNGLFLIKLESFKNYGKKFSEIIFKELKNSNFQNFYDQKLFDNIKEFYIDTYSSFRNLNLPDFLKFYLDNLCDKLSIDSSNQTKFLKIRKMIEEIDTKKVSKFSNSIFEGARISFIYMGDIDTEESLQKTKNFITNLFRGDVQNKIIFPTREETSRILFRKPNKITTVFRIQNESTQPELNAYLTYFYLGGGITKKKELYLKVILHFMEKFLVDDLETKFNIEKIEVSIINYYNNFGIMIYFTGAFVPHLIEYDIEKSFLDFSNYLKSKRINVFKIIAKGILDNMKKKHENLNQMSAQLYDIYTNQCISNDLFTYDNAIIDFTSVGLIEMIEELFFKKETTKRIVFEVYNEELTKDIMDYKLKESLTLDGEQYAVYGKQAIGSRFKFFSALRESLINTYNLGLGGAA